MHSVFNFWYATGRIAGKVAGQRKSGFSAKRKWMRKKKHLKRRKRKRSLPMREQCLRVAAKAALMKPLLVQRRQKTIRRSPEKLTPHIQGAYLSSLSSGPLFLRFKYRRDACVCSRHSRLRFCKLDTLAKQSVSETDRLAYPSLFFVSVSRLRRTRSSAGIVDQLPC